MEGGETLGNEESSSKEEEEVARRALLAEGEATHSRRLLMIAPLEGEQPPPLRNQSRI